MRACPAPVALETRNKKLETTPMLILASASPRRAELLRNAGIAFTAIPASVPEERRAGEDPVSYARRLASEKARAIARQHPNDVIVGADTIVVLHGNVPEKPRDA